MITYSQHDTQWSNATFGTYLGKPVSCDRYGCYVCSIAELLELSGWSFTPADVIRDLKAVNGFTPDGEASWSSVIQAFPMFSYGDTGNPTQFHGSIVQGRFSGGSLHYMSTAEGTLYDPWTGTNTAPCELTGYVQHVSITRPSEQSIVPVHRQFDPFNANLSYSDIYSSEAGRIQRYLVAKGFLSDADLAWNGDPAGGVGYYGRKTSAAVDRFQKVHGIYADASYFGYWYDASRAKANQDLTY